MLNKVKPTYLFVTGLIFILILNIILYVYTKERQVNEQAAKANDSLPELIEKVEVEEIVEADLAIGEGVKQMIIYEDPTATFAPEYYEKVKTLLDEREDIKVAWRFIPYEEGWLFDYFSSSLICANEQGYFMQMYDEVMQASKNKTLSGDYKLGASSIYPLDLENFEECMQSDLPSAELTKWKREAELNAIIGVPSTVIDGILYPGSYQLDDFVDSAGHQRKGLRTILGQIEE